ncbi:MAG: hypothetical protein MIO88_04550 [Methanoregulaceae archaeon]|jgi:hypothetical protein|nr:hypothetical protein [Methanoregulaceae archaeon]
MKGHAFGEAADHFNIPATGKPGHFAGWFKSNIHAERGGKAPGACTDLKRR